MTSYLYAPKDDCKHRAYWRELYTVEEADHLQGLAHQRAMLRLLGAALKWGKILILCKVLGFYGREFMKKLYNSHPYPSPPDPLFPGL